MVHMKTFLIKYPFDCDFCVKRFFYLSPIWLRWRWPCLTTRLCVENTLSLQPWCKYSHSLTWNSLCCFWRSADLSLIYCCFVISGSGRGVGEHWTGEFEVSMDRSCMLDDVNCDQNAGAWLKCWTALLGTEKNEEGLACWSSIVGLGIEVQSIESLLQRCQETHSNI